MANPEIDDSPQQVYLNEGTFDIEDGPGQFTIDLNYDRVARSKFTRKRHKKQNISFGVGQASAGFIFYYDKEVKEIATIEAGYTNTDIHWKENPYFHKKDFNVATLSVGAVTKRICRWLWKSKLAWNIDMDHPNFSEYSTWDFIGWGRYSYTDDIGIHLGLIVMTGMRIDHVYPILGFDWKFNEKWKVNAIFPLNISVVYAFDDNWSLDLAARGWETRNRVGKNEKLSKALVQYSNTGIELGANYDLGHRVHANIHIGYTTGGRLRIADKNNHHHHRLKFKAAPYAGGEIQLNF